MSTNERVASPNVYGIETEYSCMLIYPGNTVYEIVGGCHSADRELELFQQPRTRGISGLADPGETIATALTEMGIVANPQGLLSNGGRLYLDPSGPEYCTPETASAEDAVMRSFEGDTILLGVFRWMQEQGYLESFQINRRVVDHNRTSRGIHLNTLTHIDPGSSGHPPITTWLGAVNVAKGALFGSGGILVDEEGNTAFHHSPRLSVTNRIAENYGSYKLRPLVRHPFKRDRGLVGASRIETVTSDALNFGWPLKASLVVTNAVTQLIELGFGSRLPVLDANRGIDSAQSVGQYGSEGVVFVEDEEGYSKGVTSLDLLRSIAETVLRTDHEVPFLDKESDQVLGEVIDVADKMARDPLSVIDQVESVARKAAIERTMEKREVAIDSERICRVDYAWDKVGGGLAETHRNKGNFGWLGFGPRPGYSAAKKRLTTPPATTRALVRGTLVQAQNGRDISEWDVVDFGEGKHPVHPLATTIPEGVRVSEDLLAHPAIKALR